MACVPSVTPQHTVNVPFFRTSHTSFLRSTELLSAVGFHSVCELPPWTGSRPEDTATVVWHTLGSVSPFGSLNPCNNCTRKVARHYKWHHSSSVRARAWKRCDRYIIDITHSRGVGHRAVATVARTHTHTHQVMKLNTVDNINKVRGASLFPCGQIVCNKLQRDRRGYGVRVGHKTLMQLEGDVSHRKSASIHTAITGGTTAARLNPSHYCDIRRCGWNKGLCNRCISYQAASQFVFSRDAVSTLEGERVEECTPLKLLSSGTWPQSVWS